MDDALARFAKTLKEAGHSVTKTRQIVFRGLLSEEPLSLHDLVSRCAEVNRSSVYRTLPLFEQLGIVNRIQQGWKYTLELSEAYNTHHHHVTCIRCGATIPIIESEEIEHAIHDLASEAGYTIASHLLEIRGICAKCTNTQQG